MFKPYAFRDTRVESGPVSGRQATHPTPFYLFVSRVVLIITCAFSFRSRVGHHLYLFLSGVVLIITYTFSFPESCLSPRVPFLFRSRVGHHVYLFLSTAVSVTTCTFSFSEPCRSPHPHRAVQLPVGLRRHPGHQRVAAGRADGDDATCGNTGGSDAGLEGGTVPPGLLHRHPHTHPRLRPAAVDGWASHLFFFLLKITVLCRVIKTQCTDH